MAGQVVGFAESEPCGFDFVSDLAVYAEQGVGGVGITTGGPKPTTGYYYSSLEED